MFPWVEDPRGFNKKNPDKPKQEGTDTYLIEVSRYFQTPIEFKTVGCYDAQVL